MNLRIEDVQYLHDAGQREQETTPKLASTIHPTSQKDSPCQVKADPPARCLNMRMKFQKLFSRYIPVAL